MPGYDKIKNRFTVPLPLAVPVEWARLEWRNGPPANDPCQRPGSVQSRMERTCVVIQWCTRIEAGSVGIGSF